MSTTIAIDCRLDYEIIFPENSKPSTDYQINVSLIKLAFNDDIATLPEGITCTLPESLKSQYEITGLFIDEEGTVPLTAGMTISTKDLTDMDTMNGVIIDGALTVYVKIELLSKSKYSITWKYKTSNNESTQEDTEVFENNLPIPPSFVQTFVAKENNVLYKYSFASWSPTISEATKDCTYEATYDKTEYAPNIPYLINNVSLFENAVPYYYGSGSPAVNYYKPIGEDDKAETNDIKIQIYSGDIYTVTESLASFCIGGQPISYIKKGTFPKLRSENIQTDSNAEAIWQPDPLWQHNLTKTNEDASKCTNFVIIGRFDKEKKLTNIQCKDLTTSSVSITEAVTIPQLKEVYSNEFTDESSLPTRLCFVMTAGGGGGAGVNRIDTGSCSTGDDRYYPIPGGGGGGASTALGVLKFDCPEIVYRTVFLGGKYQSLLGVVGKIDGTDRDEFYPVVAPSNPTTYITKDQGVKLDDLYVSSVRFHITGGCHGKGNGESGKRVDESATDGSDGYDSAILVNFYLHSKDETSPSDDNKKYETSDEGTIRKVVTVCGGCGGKAATSTNDGTVYGGKGGIITDKYALKTSAFIDHLKSFAGSDGANITISGESGTPGSLSKYDLDLTSAYYSNIPDSKEYRIEFSYAQEVGGVANEEKLTGCVYGGYSFGRGSRGTDMCAEFGGGGCCLKTKEGVTDEDKTSNPDSQNNIGNYQLNEPTNGADGYFALFY